MFWNILRSEEQRENKVVTSGGNFFFLGLLLIHNMLKYDTLACFFATD